MQGVRLLESSKVFFTQNRRKILVWPGQWTRRGALMLGLSALLVTGCQTRQQKAAKHFESGQHYFQQQKFEEAAIEFRRAKEEDPDSWEAAHYAGLSDLKLGRIQEGLRELNAAIEVNPKAAGPRLDLAQLMIDGNQSADARQQLELVEETEPNNPRVHVLFGRSYLIEQNYKFALEEFEKASALTPNDEQLWVAAGLAAIGTGAYPKAEQYLQRAITLRPDLPDAQRNRANLLELTGHPKEAEAALVDVTNRFPKSLDLNLVLAEFYFRKQNIARLEELFGRLGSQEAAFRDIHVQLGDFWMLRNQVERAAAEYEKGWARHPDVVVQKKLISANVTVRNLERAESLNDDLLQKSPQDLDARTFRGALLFLRGDLSASVTELQAVLKDDPNSAMTHFYLGLDYSATNRTESARNEFLECIKLDNKFLQAFLKLAEISLRDVDSLQAIYFSQQAISLAPGLLDGYLLLAQGEMLKPDLPAARATLKRVESYPNLPAEYYLVLARWYEQNNDPKSAMLQYDAALSHSTQPVDVLTQMSRGAVQHGRTGSAIARIKQWSASARPDSGAQQLLAELYLENRDIASATAAVEEALRLNPNDAYSIFLKGRILQARGSSAAALTMLDTAIQADPKLTNAYLAASDLSLFQGQYDAAARYLNSALAQDPTSFEAKRALVRLQAETRDNLDATLGSAQELKKKAPNDALVRDSLAWIYYQKDLNELALTELKPVANSLSSDPRGQFHLGMVYLKAGRAKEGDRALRRALDLGLAPESVAAVAHKALATLK